MKNFKFVKQQDYMDCGVACIQMILNYYNSEIPIHKLREMTGTDRDGASAFGIKQCIERLNFDCLAVQGDSAVWFDEEIRYPVIAHVVIEKKYMHYVVVFGVSGNHLFIADPAKGKYKITIDEFSLMWTGVLLIPSPNESYCASKETVGGLLSFVPILFKSKKLVMLTIIVSIFLTIFSIISSYYFQVIIDKVLPNNNLYLLNILSLGLIMVYTFRVIFGYLRHYLLIVLGQKMGSDVMLNYFKHVLGLSMGFFSSRQSGEIISRFLDANKIIDALTNASLTLFLDTSMVFIVGTVLFLQNKILFCITLLSLPIYLLIILSFVKKYDKANEEEMSAGALLNSNIIESLTGIETIKAYRGESFVYDKISREFMDFMKKSLYKVNLDNIQSSLKQLAQLFGSGFILWMGAYYVHDGIMTIGELITYNALLVFFTNPLESIINLQVKIQTAQVASKRLNEVLSISQENSNLSKEITSFEFKETLKVNNVSFSYNLKKSTIEDITCSIDKNSKVALVGVSGSGKSTLAKLLVRFYDATEGDICYDDMSIQNISHYSLRKQVTYVPQTSFFFNGTILENLVFGLNYTPDDYQLKRVCEIAEIYDFIEEQPLKFNTLIEEGGGNLSGGQKQRLAIARSLLTNSKVIIFDEATSGLDVFLEKKIINNLVEVRDVTMLIITHSLPIAKYCQKILVMDKGKLIEEGNHKNLLQINGLYRKLWDTVY